MTYICRTCEIPCKAEPNGKTPINCLYNSYMPKWEEIKEGISFPCKDGVWTIPADFYKKYTTKYYRHDVDREIQKAWDWIDRNPRRKKKVSGMKRYLGGWLDRQNLPLKPDPTIQWEKTFGEWLRTCENPTSNAGFVANLRNPEFKKWAMMQNRKVK